MSYSRLVLCLGLCAFFTSVRTADAQIETLSRTGTSTTDAAIAALTKRIEALENTVAQLQEKLAFIKSVNPLVLEPGGDLTIRANQISLDAGMGVSLRAGAGASIRSGSTLLIEAAATLDLKGNSVRHNGGTMPIACIASTVNGQTATGGGGLRTGEHAHGVTLPVVPCSATVGVPGPGQ